MAAGSGKILVTWTDGSPSSAAFNVYRAAGTCSSPGPFSVIATPGVPSAVDTTVSAGMTYAYQVTGLDATGLCESAPSGCVEATESGAGYSYGSLVGCRMVDTRFGAPLVPMVSRNFLLAGTCGVPVTAKLLVFTATVLPSPSTSGTVALPNLTVFFNGTPGVPPSVFGISPLGSSGHTTALNTSPGAAHLILDVFGYFE